MSNTSFAIILMVKTELVALLCLSSWCIVVVVWLFLVVPRGLSAVCDCDISSSYSLTISEAFCLRFHRRLRVSSLQKIKIYKGNYILSE